MVPMKVVYEGGLHCLLTHGPSGSRIATDAPKDNMGKGEAFSPTDLTAVSLGACMLTVMGIYAQKQGLSLEGAAADVDKRMVADPERRIGSIAVRIRMPAGIDPAHRQAIEHAGHTCPVRKSLAEGVSVQVTFSYPD